MIYRLVYVPAIPTHCRRKVDTLLLPRNLTENIVTVGFHVTTAIMCMTNTAYRNMLNKNMNSSVARNIHTPNNKDVLYII